jgi:hypothetical protein
MIRCNDRSEWSFSTAKGRRRKGKERVLVMKEEMVEEEVVEEMERLEGQVVCAQGYTSARAGLIEAPGR